MTNTLTAIEGKIISRSLGALRSRLVLPQVARNDFQGDAAEFGETINVPVPVPQAAAAVTPGVTAPNPRMITPPTTPIVMDQWFQNDFHLTDKELREIDSRKHFIPMQMEEAIEGLATQINTHLWTFYTRVFSQVGVATDQRFSSLADSAAAHRVLGEERTPTNLRRMVIDFEQEEAAMQLADFRSWQESSDPNVITEGVIGRKVGFDWMADHHTPTHVAGSQTAVLDVNAAGAPLGATAIPMDTDGTGVAALNDGDIITFSNHTQTYAVQGDFDQGNGVTGGIMTIEPGLRTALAGAETIATILADHDVSLALQRDALAYVTRVQAMSRSDTLAGRRFSTLRDPISGVILRLELLGQYKQTTWELDALWGGGMVRPENAARIVSLPS